LEDFAGNPSDVYTDSSIDPAMKNAFAQCRKFMMAMYGLSEYEAWTIITQAINFGVTQLVNGNWGVHAIIPKAIFEGVERNPACAATEGSGASRNATSSIVLVGLLAAAASLLFLW
jgi:hypothetical protein